MIDLSKIKNAFFIGIGGIGISASAGILKSRGVAVAGSDARESEVVEKLRVQGISVSVPHSAENIRADIDLVVYSVAVGEDNPERIRARELNLPELSYPQLLGLLMQGKFGIGVSGTDGKTTTTAMLAKILIDAEYDPTVVLGSQAEFLTDNWRAGQSEYFVFESDEYRRAFSNYNPQAVIITNVGVDHLDYYKDCDEYLATFAKYLERMPADGLAVINNDDRRSVMAGVDCPARRVTYAIESPADYRATDIKITAGRQEFAVVEKNQSENALTLKIPGRYNIYNALGAIALARELGIDWQIIAESLASFKGVWRRFDNLGRLGQTEVIADYAHTPPAIRQAIRATEEFYPAKNILFVFQPHQYARTKNLFAEFSEAFKEADMAVIADIFYVRGREKPEDYDVGSKKLAEAIRANGSEAVYGGDLAETELLVRQLADQFDVIMVLGAGDIYDLAKNLVK